MCKGSIIALVIIHYSPLLVPVKPIKNKLTTETGARARSGKKRGECVINGRVVRCTTQMIDHCPESSGKSNKTILLRKYVYTSTEESVLAFQFVEILSLCTQGKRFLHPASLQ